MRLLFDSSNLLTLLAGLTLLGAGCSRTSAPVMAHHRDARTARPEASPPATKLRHPATISTAPSLKHPHVAPTSPDPATTKASELEPPLPEVIAQPTPPAPSVFSEASAVKYAVLHSPTSYRSRAALEVARGETSEMRSEMLPTLQLQSEVGRADRLSSNRQDDPADAGIGIFLRQRLFDGKAGWFRYLSAKHRTEAARYEREAAQNRVAAEVRLGFARMRHWYRLSKAQKTELDAVQSLVERLSLLTAYGLSTSESLSRLTAQGENLRAGAEEALTKLQGERHAILALIGAPASAKLSLGRTEIPKLDASSTAMAGAALQNRPELKAAAYAVHAQRASLESVRRERYPSADLVLGLATEGRIDQSISDTWQTDGRVGVRAEWNAFDFGRNKAKQQQELATLREAEADYAQLKRTVQLDILKAVESIQLAHKQYKAANAEVTESSKSLALAMEAFQNDAGDIETVIRAHRSVRQSRYSESTARFREEEGQVLLAFSQGAAAQIGSAGKQALSMAIMPAKDQGSSLSTRNLK